MYALEKSPDGVQISLHQNCVINWAKLRGLEFCLLLKYKSHTPKLVNIVFVQANYCAHSDVLATIYGIFNPQYVWGPNFDIVCTVTPHPQPLLKFT